MIYAKIVVVNNEEDIEFYGHRIPEGLYEEWINWNYTSSDYLAKLDFIPISETFFYKA